MAFAQPKRYLLQVSSKLSEEPSLSLFGGLSHKEKALSEIFAEAEKAFRSGYEKILLPWNFTAHSDIDSLLDWIRLRPEKFVLQSPLRRLPAFQKILGGLWREPRISFDFLPLDSSDFHPSHTKESCPDPCLSAGQKPQDILLRLKPSYSITVPAFKGENLERLADSIPPVFRKKTRMHFPFSHKKNRFLYSSKEMYDFLSRRRFLPPDMDVCNLSIPGGYAPEVELEAKFFKIPKASPEISVIIPSCNSKRSLALVLSHLFQQDLEKEKFEVIVVDDGSHDGTWQSLQRLEFLKAMQFKYIYFPRKKRRIFPYYFRAGAARNLGAKHAKGEVLAFLDSDILVEESRLSSILKFMENTLVLQHPRYRLKLFAPKQRANISKWRHTVRSRYWENFYARSQIWNQMPLPWKYISSHSLSLAKELFLKAGRFRTNHIFYGFEDTDLGYRLYKMGRRFMLKPAASYHVFRMEELLYPPFWKNRMLGLSAQIFFHNTHCMSGYREFEHLISNAVPDA